MSRKNKLKNSPKNSKSLFSWPKILIVIVPLFATLLIMLTSDNGRAVLGVSDSSDRKRESSKSAEKLSEIEKLNKISRQSCNRVAAFSANTICEINSKEKTNNSFKSYTYTCEDGTSGTVSLNQDGVTQSPTSNKLKCITIEKAYESARKLCNKKCAPSKTPKPTKEANSSN